MLIGGPGPLQPSGGYRDGAVSALALVKFAYPEMYMPTGFGAGNPAAGWRPPAEVLRDMLKKLGLEVQPGVGPVSTTVIDHIDEPTPN